MNCSVHNFGVAQKHYFDYLQKRKANPKTRKVGKPKFKKFDKDGVQKCYFAIDANEIIYRNGKLKLPKFKDSLNINWHRKLPETAKIKSACITKKLNGHYHISITFTSENTYKLPETNEVIGLDMGITTYCIDSNGNKYNLPKSIKKLVKKYRALQKQLSTAKTGSKNRAKIKQRMRDTNEKISNIKADWIHKTTTQIVTNNQVICIESLDIEQMKSNKKYTPAIQQQSWGEFFRCLKYKAEKFNRILIAIDQWYPSSQICNECGYRNYQIKGNTKVRAWICPNCQVEHDRDINAAINILKQGIELL